MSARFEVLWATPGAVYQASESLVKIRCNTVPARRANDPCTWRVFKAIEADSRRCGGPNTCCVACARVHLLISTAAGVVSGGLPAVCALPGAHRCSSAQSRAATMQPCRMRSFRLSVRKLLGVILCATTCSVSAQAPVPAPAGRRSTSCPTTKPVQSSLLPETVPWWRHRCQRFPGSAAGRCSRADWPRCRLDGCQQPCGCNMPGACSTLIRTTLHRCFQVCLGLPARRPRLGSIELHAACSAGANARQF